MRNMLSIMALLLAASPCLANEPTVETNVVYGKAGGEALKLDLVKPTAETQRHAAIVMIHGGGWQAGDKGDFLPFAKEAAKRGYTGVLVNYRHAPKHVFPAQVEDVKAAVRWVRANASKLEIDPTRIGAIGNSAGGHLVMMLGTLDPADGLEGDGDHKEQSSKVQAVVGIFGPTNFLSEYPDVTKPTVKAFLGGTLDDNRDVYRQASPITYVNKGDAAMLLFHGTKDALVPYDQAVQMATALTEAGVPGRVELMLGAEHGWGGKELERTAKVSLDFFDQQLKP